jgi:homoserine kinase
MLTVRVPATIANMGPGFDSFGMAVSLCNRFSFQESDRDTLAFSPESTVQPEGLKGDGHDNFLFLAMNRLYEHIHAKRPRFRVDVAADIPVARGLGSSSTAVAAGLVAANRMAGAPLSSQELLNIAIEMEGHPDNVAPALLGGVVLYDTAPYQLPWPTEWRVLVLSPDYPVLTEEARRILPKTIAHADAVHNLRKASLLTYALLRENPEAFRASLHDRLHQPYRRQLIREYDAIERLVMEAGAFGMVISGSGSSMAVFYPTEIHAALRERLESAIQSQGWSLLLNEVTVDTEGARILTTPSGVL